MLKLNKAKDNKNLSIYHASRSHVHYVLSSIDERHLSWEQYIVKLAISILAQPLYITQIVWFLIHSKCLRWFYLYILFETVWNELTVNLY